MGDLSVSTQVILEAAQKTLRSEAASLSVAADRLGDTFCRAVTTILRCQGKVVTTGLGKSGHIARKISATLASTGTPSFFVHPTEAMHGDLGMISSEDCLLALAHGGETHEVIEVGRNGRRLGLPIIAITGKPDSTLAVLADYVLEGSVEEESCPLNLAPTNSSTLALALGDALAVSLMQARGFKVEQFATLHPAGSLGRKLAMVDDHMRENWVSVGKEDSFTKVLSSITDPNYGILAVVATDGSLQGIITDGDIRRALGQFSDQVVNMKAGEIMTVDPKTIAGGALALDAVKRMEELKISSLFVVSQKAGVTLPIGLVRMYDLLEAKII